MPALNKKRTLVILALFLLYLVSTAASYLYFSKSKAEEKDQLVESTPTPSPKTSEFFNVLLLGYGGPGHEGSNLTDAMIVVNVDKEQKKATLISIPRDVWVPILESADTKRSHKINAAFAIGKDDRNYPLKEPQFKGEKGAGEMSKNVVGQVLGMPVDYFIAINFGDFVKAIDILGGIEVDVPKTFDDYFYPVKGLENENCGKTGEDIAALSATMSGFILEKQFECRYEHIHFDAGPQLMDGATVLKFVRSRHSDQHGGDFARHERQQAVLLGIKDKLLSLDAISKVDDFIEKFVDIIMTDIDKRALVEILEKYSDLADYSVATLNLSEENVFRSSLSADGQFILIPKDGKDAWSKVHDFIRQNLAD